MTSQRSKQEKIAMTENENKIMAVFIRMDSNCDFKSLVSVNWPSSIQKAL